MGAARQYRAHRHQIWLRDRALRRLHDPCRRAGDESLSAAGVGGGRQADHDHRRAVDQQLASGSAGLGGNRRSAMRLLPERSDHGGGRACSPSARIRPWPRSRLRWPTIFAVAVPISGSFRQSGAPPNSRRHRGGRHDQTNSFPPFLHPGLGCRRRRADARLPHARCLGREHRSADAVDDDRRRHRNQCVDRDRQGRHRHACGSRTPRRARAVSPRSRC